MIHPLLLWLTLSLALHHLVSKRHIKILLMLFWMSNLFSLGMEQFTASWFAGEDGLTLTVHGSPERSCSSFIPLFWRLTWIHLLPPHLYLLSPAHMSVDGGAMLIQWACGLMEFILMSLNSYEPYSTGSSFSHPRGVGADTTWWHICGDYLYHLYYLYLGLS